MCGNLIAKEVDFADFFCFIEEQNEIYGDVHCKQKLHTEAKANTLWNADKSHVWLAVKFLTRVCEHFEHKLNWYSCIFHEEKAVLPLSYTVHSYFVDLDTQTLESSQSILDDGFCSNNGMITIIHYSFNSIYVLIEAEQHEWSHSVVCLQNWLFAESKFICIYSDLIPLWAHTSRVLLRTSHLISTLALLSIHSSFVPKQGERERERETERERERQLHEPLYFLLQWSSDDPRKHLRSSLYLLEFFSTTAAHTELRPLKIPFTLLLELM